MARVVLAMSGGVDSSVAAQLLLEEGHEVVGVFMRHGEESASVCSRDGTIEASPLLPILEQRADHKQGCCSASDAEDARRVADKLGIRFYAMNLQAEFKEIVDYFVDEYSHGRTPNPCVQCNNRLKFGKLYDYADSIGAEYVATGHYARLERDTESNQVHLLRGVDHRKDQSYVLFGVRPDRFQRMLLPVGGFEKSQIRERAAELGLRVAEKKDSQEICFVTSGKHAEFVRDRRGDESTAGELVLTDGTVVGSHPGIEKFTIGQRKGLGVAFGEPRFVIRIEPDSNRVVIGEHHELGCRGLSASQTNWLQSTPAEAFECEVKFRYNSPSHPAIVTIEEDGNRFHVEFKQAVFGVAPGQAAVCYIGDEVIGGGWIDATTTDVK